MNISPASLFNMLTTPTASEKTREERQAAAAEAKLREAKAAVESLKQRNSQASEERKAIARQKIEQLKARLQMLRGMASVDPKGTARLAAQLARELGAAVKAYAAAGGVTSGMDAGGAPAAAAPTSAPAGTPTEGKGGDVANADGAPAGTDGQEAAAEMKADGKDEAAGKSANPYQQAIDEANARAAEMSRRSGEAQANNDFMSEVRRMAAELKALVRQAADKAPTDDDALSPDEARELKGVVAAMDRGIADASADLSGGGVSLLV
ncbi:hypothetical protein [Brevundimonas lenta]|uniref:Anti-sigma28 factor (Negative regulator of flagellin synthesis) n=1 Tax=Brevundimonas lenta TaxID=424796 RepID=A0A7W6JAR5_9CAUL|nr:hypothetical protein [Brevundimonas lenta]MBB4081656.1 anti-sigma28 factor (negative regulator of flagellin synthesis) [Brevundimonas lenta]